MIESMPRPLPQYVYREFTRHGRAVYYFRRGKGKRVRLPDYGSPEFRERYDELLASAAPAAAVVPANHTLEWLIDRYRETASYRAMSYATRRQRDNIFKGVAEKSGKVAFKKVTEAKIIAGRDRRSATPHQARHFLDAMRGLFRWAKEARYVAIDPTASVKNPKRKKNNGFIAWSEDEALQYERRWPAGTKERVWLHVLLYTGLRRGDAVRLGKQHVKDGIATIKTEKSGFTVEVTIPILPMLQETLDVGPTSDLAFICGDRGSPLTKESFGNLFRVACDKAGLKGRSAHGLRKLGATRAADAGATDSELDALFGWMDGRTSKIYTRAADRRRLAKQGAEKIRNALCPHLEGERPAPKKTNNKNNTLRRAK